MSHSQWEKKKYKKATSEAKISKLYTKLVRVITMEAKKSNGNKEAPGLKVAIQKARDVDMPNDNIERAIKKATESGDQYERMTYESYGPEGVGIVIEALTTNRNKAAQEIKHTLSNYDLSLAGIGSVTWDFVKKENTWIPNNPINIKEENLEKIKKLIDDLEENDEVQKVFTSCKNFN
jgi:transcriptional/translational regulatory protein YebC/TACO1